MNPNLMIRVLLIGYLCSIRSERWLVDEGHPRAPLPQRGFVHGPKRHRHRMRALLRMAQSAPPYVTA